MCLRQVEVLRRARGERVWVNCSQVTEPKSQTLLGKQLISCCEKASGLLLGLGRD